MISVQAFQPDLWLADGPPVHVAGPLTLPARMIVVRLNGDRLWINSPVDVAQSEINAIESFGSVSELVSPTRMHDWRLEAWHRAFPRAHVWPFARVRAAAGTEPWGDELKMLVFRGNLFLDEIWFLHRASHTVIAADFVQNYAPRPHRPLQNLFLRLSGAQGGGVPNDIKLTMIHRQLARESLAQLLSWEFDNLVLAHGACITGNARAFVTSAFAFL